YRADRHFPLIPGTFRQRQRVTHPVFVAKFDFRQKENSGYKSAAHYTRTLCFTLFQLLEFTARGYSPTMLTEIKQRIVLITVAIATVQPQRSADFALQLCDLFMSQTTHRQYPTTIATLNLAGDKINPRQPGRIEINRFNHRLRRAGNQPDISIGT